MKKQIFLILTLLFIFTISTFCYSAKLRIDYNYEMDDVNTYTVMTPLGLNWVAEQVNTGADDFEGKTINLLINGTYNLSDYNPWTPIGNDSHPFKGTFNGRNSMIYNLNLNGANIALFGNVSNVATIKNLNVKQTNNISATGSVAFIASTNAGTIEYTKVYQESTYTCGASSFTFTISGIAGTNNGIIRYCSVEGLNFTDQCKPCGITESNIGTVSDCYVYDMYVVLPISVARDIGGISNTNSGAIQDSYVTISFGGTGGMMRTLDNNNLHDNQHIGAITHTNSGTITNTYYLGLANLVGIANTTDTTTYSESIQTMQSQAFVITLNGGLTGLWSAGVSPMLYPQFTPISIISIEKAQDVNTLNTTLLDKDTGLLGFKISNTDIPNGSNVTQGTILTPYIKLGTGVDYITVKKYIVNGTKINPGVDITAGTISTLLSAYVENSYQTNLKADISKYSNLYQDYYTSGSWFNYTTVLNTAQSTYDIMGVNLNNDIYRTNLATAVNSLVKNAPAISTTSTPGGSISSPSESVNYGELAEYTALPDTGYLFESWTDTNTGKILSTNAVYSFYLTQSEYNLTANFVADTVKIIFNDQYGKFLGIQTSNPGSIITLPTTISRPGYSFDYWLNGGTHYAEGADFTIPSSDTTITAYYTANSNTYNLTLTGGTAKDNKISGYLYSEVATVTANDPPSSQKFAYWIDEITGNIVSYNTVYTFSMPGDTSLVAIFIDDETILVKTPSISLTDPAILNTTTGKISFIVKVDKDTLNAEGYQMVECGVLLLEGTDIPTSLDFNTANVIIKSSSRQNAEGQFSITKNEAAGKTYTCRAYLVYKDTTGKTYTTYSSNLVTGTLP